MNRGAAPSAWSVDTAQWPLVVTAPTEHVDEPAALIEMYKQYEAVLARGARFVCLFDLRGYKSSPVSTAELDTLRQRILDGAKGTT